MLHYHQAFHELRHALQPLYDAREAAAIAHEVLYHVTGLDKLQRISQQETPLTAAQEAELQRCLRALRSGEPLQYVLGHAWFLGRRYRVDRHVLIPRPETEELVQWIVADRQQCAAPGDLLDIGTGSGCIAVSLKLMLLSARVEACDISSEALDVARANAQEQGADVRFFQADILDEKGWPLLPLYDVLVSNPPYIPVTEKDTLHSNVKDFEPSLALFTPGDDPLLFYRAIALLGMQRLTPGGAVYCELHRDYAEATAALFIQQGYKNVTIRRDMHGNPRMLKAAR